MRRKRGRKRGRVKRRGRKRGRGKERLEFFEVLIEKGIEEL